MEKIVTSEYPQVLYLDSYYMQPYQKEPDEDSMRGYLYTTPILLQYPNGLAGTP